MRHFPHRFNLYRRFYMKQFKPFKLSAIALCSLFAFSGIAMAGQFPGTYSFQLSSPCTQQGMITLNADGSVVAVDNDDQITGDTAQLGVWESKGNKIVTIRSRFFNNSTPVNLSGS